MPIADRGPHRHEFTVPSTGQVIAVYASGKVGRALDEVTDDLNLYTGVRLYEVLEAVYMQGLRDGAGQPRPGRPRALP